jgi:signal transduction histidine kinase
LKQHLQRFDRLFGGFNAGFRGGGVGIVLWIVALLTPLCPALSAENTRATVTTAAQLLSLPQELINDGKTKVQIRGMVTYYAPAGSLLFVHDGTAGVFVWHTGERLGLHAGQFIEVTGFAGPGLYSPIVASPKILPLKGGTPIPPRPVSLAEIDLGGLDAQWVEFTGLVRGQSILHDWLALELAETPHRITVWVADHQGYERMRLVGSYVRVRGVIAGSYSNNKLTSFKACVNQLSDVTIVKEAPESPAAEPLLSIRELRGRQARALTPGQVRTKGIVTLCWPGYGLFIQDSNASLKVFPNETVEGLVAGDAVEVAGFPGPVLGVPALEDAVVRKLGTEPAPSALRISTGDLFHSDHNSELVEIEADLLGESGFSSNSLTLALQSEDHYLTGLIPLASPPRETEAIRPGSRLRLTGICVKEDDLAGADPKIRLLLRSPSDIAVVALPRPLAAHNGALTKVIAMGATLLLLLALWYIAQQHARTKHILQAQTSLQTEMHQNVQQLRRSMEERERIGRDLHDDIIQSIYAVGLNLEDCRRVVRNSPQLAEGRLTSAIETLNSSIRHVRGFLAGLEPKVFNGREFKTALKSLALTDGDDPTQFQLEVDSTAANRLTPAQATQLLHIAKEAMTNSLRHANATTLVVSLHPISTGLRLEVFDNGEGFNPEALNGKGHGLRNMTARARDIDADLQIVSAIGQGCRILVNVPQRNGNEHG